MRPALALLLTLLASPAFAAGNMTGLTVTACGSPQVAFVAGNPGTLTVDTNGLLCVNSFGAAVGGTIRGLGNASGLVVATCGSPPTVFKSGNPGPLTLNTLGGVCE